MIGSYYYPEQWPKADWPGDIKKLKELGLSHIHLAEFAWCRLEPEEGRFDFDWLAEVIELSHKEGLEVVLCTPSATPPIWLSERYPEALMLKENGRRAEHGARAHGCVNAPAFNTHTERVAAAMAERFGQHPAVIGWQLDNEIGHYTEAPCYCEACQAGFIRFCKDRYGDIETLNEAWAGDFWSQRYQRFEQIKLPNVQTLPYFPNEHARLDFLEFFSRSQARFLSRQAAVLRPHIKEQQWITHNFMTADPFVNPRHVEDGSLELFTLTNYPVAGIYHGPKGRERFRVGDPLLIASHHDFSRGHGVRWGVMEQQPGQVNWGPYNTRPYPGAVRLWLWTAIAHGASFLDTYRLRQPRAGAEQYHEGLISLDGQTPSAGGREFSQVAAELALLQEDLQQEGKSRQPRAAILRDWRSLRAVELHPQSAEFKAEEAWLAQYGALKGAGFAVDVLDAEASVELSHYAAVSVAYVDLADAALVQAILTYAEAGGHVILSARSLTRDRRGHFPKAEYGAWASQLAGGRLLGYDVLPPGAEGHLQISGWASHAPWRRWAEQWEAPEEALPLARHSDQFYAGQLAAFELSRGAGTVTTVGFEAAATAELVKARLLALHEEAVDIPSGCIYQERGPLSVLLNYQDHPVLVPKLLRGQAPLLIGAPELPPADVAVWRTAER